MTQKILLLLCEEHFLIVGTACQLSEEIVSPSLQEFPIVSKTHTHIYISMIILYYDIQTHDLISASSPIFHEIKIIEVNYCPTHILLSSHGVHFLTADREQVWK